MNRYYALTLKTLDMGYMPGNSHEPYGRYEVVMADEAEAAIRELVDAGRRALNAVGYEGQLHEHDALHELDALIAKYKEDA